MTTDARIGTTRDTRIGEPDEAGMGVAMDAPIGTLRGLDACASLGGTFTVLALDHRQNLRLELRPSDPRSVSYEELVDFKRAVVAGVADVATGVLLDPEVGAAQLIADGSLPRDAGLLVALEATGYQGVTTDRRSRILPDWGVAKVKRMGADAVKLLLHYHPDAQGAAAQEALLAQVGQECRAADLPLFVEALSFSIVPGPPKPAGEDRRRVVVETARRLTAVGGDVLKAEFPYDPAVTDRGRWSEACAELDAASSVPWVLLSGGLDDATFEAQVEIACEAGASGVLVGRSVWSPSARMASTEQATWLRSEGRMRLERLARLVERHARPWRERSPLARTTRPAEGWYRTYPA